MLTLMVWMYMVLYSHHAIGDNSSHNSTHRGEKALSVFSVVKFPNTACTSSTAGRNGTCYTSSECTANSGTASGTCASSFGVCCIFEKSCGSGAISQNTTYFTSSSRVLGTSCALTICKCSTDVCQLRLDFETFALNNPVTVSTVTIGPATAAAGTGNSLGACNVDQFSVTVPGGKSPPVICGTNTGSHMYVPAADQCNILAANIGSSSTATTASFTIKITQVPCSSKTKAPNGCLQYYTGTTGTITTFNYNSAAGVLLTNQDYSACIRSERTYCAICYWSSTFSLSVPNGIAAIGTLGVDTNCGLPALTAPYANGGSYDYIEIPDGQCDSPVSNAVATTETNDRYCGTSLRCLASVPYATTANAAGQTVCSMNKPFKISVHSDSLEYIYPTTDGEGLLANNRGFSIGYYQKTSCLTRPTS